MNRPTFTLIAGANGSGKSTLTSSNPDIFASFPILDPDAIAKTIQSSVAASSAIAAGRQALQIAKQLLHDKKSFAVETTLSGKNYLQMILDARGLGFEIVLVYIGTEAVEINLVRIANRVFVGGTTFLKQMSVGGINVVSRMFQSPFPVRIMRSFLITPPRRDISLWA